MGDQKVIAADNIQRLFRTLSRTPQAEAARC